MTGLVRKAMFMGTCGLLAAATAFANVPSPANSDVPSVIRSYYQDSPGVPHVAASTITGGSRAFTIVVRDFTNNVIAGSFVELDFTNCTDFRLGDDAIAGNGTVVCAGAGATGTVTGTTNALGEFTATLLGGSSLASVFPPPGGPIAGAGCIEVRADGVVIGNANLFIADNNGTGGCSGPDLSNLGIDFLYAGTASYQRSDYDGNGVVAGPDLAELKLLTAQAGAPGLSSSSYCP